MSVCVCVGGGGDIAQDKPTTCVFVCMCASYCACIYVCVHVCDTPTILSDGPEDPLQDVIVINHVEETEAIEVSPERQRQDGTQQEEHNIHRPQTKHRNIRVRLFRWLSPAACVCVYVGVSGTCTADTILRIQAT